MYKGRGRKICFPNFVHTDVCIWLAIAKMIQSSLTTLAIFFGPHSFQD